jgi:hypothetical protein
MGVAEDGGSPTADVVEVLAAVRTEQLGALGGSDEDRLTAYGAKGPHRRIHPAGQHPFGTLQQTS